MATNIVPISDLRRQATGIIKTLREDGEVVYITQNGRPSAVLVGYEEYEALLAKLEEKQTSDRQPGAEQEAAVESNSFLTVAQSANLKGPPDWSRNLDEYLYGGKQFDED